ncbi:MFS transporter [Actinoallomurus iriomotensis]|uniref:MFS transporter n=1 Tax=Actinoallomurus iriomotensis TaxID=478107 RepID=A0A9W6W0R8_9ACTN|nr:MFS transporter [Actinoallomurus iriomotensis]GLY87185.1 MFS transporter [Actinoallomurus iriomotensis]
MTSTSASARLNNRTIGLDRAAFALLATIQVTLIASITVITVALPAIQRDLRAGPRDLVLAASAYGSSFGGLLLLGGRLTDLLRPRAVFVAGLAVFGAGSAAAGLAPAFAVLVAARFAQGAGAALAAPAAMALLGDVAPGPGEQAQARAVWGILSSAGATLGTVLSGAVTSWVSWRWLFAGPVVVAALGVAAARRLPSTGADRSGRRLDAPGALLATAGLAALLYGLGSSVLAVLAGLVLLALFGLVERCSPDPLAPLPFLRSRALPLAATALCAAAMASAFYLLALYFQQVRGLSPLRTSLLFLVPAPALAAAGVLAGRLLPRVGVRRLLAAGPLVSAAGLLLLARLGVPYAGLLVFPLGAGVTFAAATVAATEDVPAGQAGLAGGVLGAAMEVGPPVGLTVLVAIANAHSGEAGPGYAVALRVAAAALALTAPLALLRRRTR